MITLADKGKFFSFSRAFPIHFLDCQKKKINAHMALIEEWAFLEKGKKNMSVFFFNQAFSRYLKKRIFFLVSDAAEFTKLRGLQEAVREGSIIPRIR